MDALSPRHMGRVPQNRTRIDEGRQKPARVAELVRTGDLGSGSLCSTGDLCRDPQRGEWPAGADVDD